MLFFKKKDKNSKTVLVAPCDGKTVALDKLSDVAFSYLGVGCAVNVDSLKGKVDIVAPVSGKLVAAYPTKHAYGIQTSNGIEVLVHIGINTVNLNGEGFDSSLKQGDKVNQGEVLATIDLDKIRKHKVATDVIIVITDNEHREGAINLLAKAAVKVNQPLFEI
ncbi:MAG: PTS glucose transporter subunit IIA [Mycoplasma sp.]